MDPNTTNSVTIPRGMTAKDVAECLNAYLLGASFAEGRALSHGPFLHDGKWQLDGSNDYWLREIASGQVAVTCRYRRQQAVVSAMLALFSSRFSPTVATDAQDLAAPAPFNDRRLATARHLARQLGRPWTGLSLEESQKLMDAAGAAVQAADAAFAPEPA